MLGDSSTKIDSLNEQLERARRERDEYREQVHTLAERVRSMTSAATAAAGTAAAALTKLQRYKTLADVAVGFVNSCASEAALVFAVEAFEGSAPS